jgi:glutathione peroxidase
MLKLLILSVIIAATATVYGFKVNSIDGAQIDFGNFQHKKILIVNAASGSRYASQYASLERLYQLYKDSLIIIVFPSNSFGNMSSTAMVH